MRLVEPNQPNVGESEPDFDLDVFILVVDVEKENTTTGFPGARENASNPDCTENTKEYSANQKKLIKEFTEYNIIPRRK